MILLNQGTLPLTVIWWIKDQKGLKNYLAKHFPNLFTNPSTVTPDVFYQIPQLSDLNVLDLPLSPVEIKIKKVISQMSSNKTTEQDGILAEIFKALELNVLQVFQHTFEDFWSTEKMPNDFCVVLIVALYKNKGSKATEISQCCPLYVRHLPTFSWTDFLLSQERTPRSALWILTRKQYLLCCCSRHKIDNFNSKK